MNGWSKLGNKIRILLTAPPAQGSPGVPTVSDPPQGNILKATVPGFSQAVLTPYCLCFSCCCGSQPPIVVPGQQQRRSAFALGPVLQAVLSKWIFCARLGKLVGRKFSQKAPIPEDLLLGSPPRSPGLWEATWPAAEHPPSVSLFLPEPGFHENQAWRGQKARCSLTLSFFLFLCSGLVLFDSGPGLYWHCWRNISSDSAPMPRASWVFSQGLMKCTEWTAARHTILSQQEGREPRQDKKWRRGGRHWGREEGPWVREALVFSWLLWVCWRRGVSVTD